MRTTHALLVVALAACGGKTVVDGPGPGAGGAGGGGGSSTTTTHTTTTTATATTTVTTSSSSGCDGVLGELSALIVEATTCNSCMDYDSCMNGPKIHDTCGCLVGASELAQQAAADAEALYQQWVSAGCGPFECNTPCLPDNATYYCTPTGTNCDGKCDAMWGG
jgi:hypothetical protein